MSSTDFHPRQPTLARRDSDPEATLLGQLLFSKRWIAIWATLGVLVTVAGVCLALAAREKIRIRSAVDTVIARPLERVSEVNGAFKELEALKLQPCSEPHLAALRSYAFRSAIIRDVIFQDDAIGQRCSGNLGADVFTLPIGGADFTSETGRRIWRNIEIAASPGVRSTLVRDGSYELLLAPEVQPVTLQDGLYALSVVLLNRASNTMLVARGSDPGIDQASLVSGSTYWRNGHLVAVACLPGQITCFVLSAAVASVLMGNVVLLVLAGIVGGTAAAVGAAWWLARRFKTGTIDALLRDAVAAGELFMHYQPIVDNRTGDAVSAEALMRWVLRSGENVPPAVFIPVAEENGLIGPLTRLALRRVSHDLGDHLRAHPDFKVSVNVAPADLVDAAFHHTLQRHFEAKGIAPAQLAFEITERTSEKLESAVTVMLELGGRGYQIYIDDFGTGYANLSYLSDLKVDKIKLDKKFTDTVGTGSLRERIVPSVIELARELGVDIIVEGVESEAQVRYFRTRGVHLMQGWLYGRPLPPAELIGTLEQSARSEAPGNVRYGESR